MLDLAQGLMFSPTKCGKNAAGWLAWNHLGSLYWQNDGGIITGAIWTIGVSNGRTRSLFYRFTVRN